MDGSVDDEIANLLNSHCEYEEVCMRSFIDLLIDSLIW